MKNGIVKRSVLGGVLAAGLLISVSAQAVCTVGALSRPHIVERVLSFNGVTYVYLRPAALTNNVAYFFTTTSDKVVSAATAAQTDRTQVQAQGNAAACPAAGTVRFMGASNYLYMLN